MIYTLIVFIIILFILVISHEAGHFFSARRFGIKVEEFGFGLPPRIKGISRRGTIYSLNALPFGGFVKIFGEEGEGANNPESFGWQPAWKRSVVLLAGVAANILLAYFAFSLVSFLGSPEALDPQQNAAAARADITITDVAPNSPATSAEIQPGDKIKQINNIVPATIEEFQKFIEKNKGLKVNVSLERNGRLLQKEIIPRLNPPAGEGPLGVSLSLIRIRKASWYMAPIDGAVITWNVTGGTLAGFGRIIKNLIIGQKSNIQISGPVGIFNVAGEARSAGFNSLLTFFGVLSVNLAIINVLPFPGLDGGRFLFIIIEKIRRKRISDRVSSLAHGIGLAILIALMILITYHDIVRLFA